LLGLNLSTPDYRIYEMRMLKIEDVHIGDEVQYNDYYVRLKNEKLSKWRVISMLQNTLIIEQFIDGQSHKRAVELENIAGVISTK
jgi:hypothetical protein